MLPFNGRTRDEIAEEPPLSEDEGVDEEIATADPEAPEMKLRKLATKPTLDEEGFNAKLA